MKSSLLPVLIIQATALVSVSALTGNAYAQTPPPNAKPAAIVTENGEKAVVTHLGGVEYHVPVGYLLSGPGRYKDPDVALSMYSLLPDLKPVSSTDPEYHIPGGWRRQANILITDEKATTSFQFRYNLHKDHTFAPMHPTGEKFGLQGFLSEKGFAGKLLESNTPVFSRTKEIEHPTEEDRKNLREEFYVDSPTHPTVYLECDGDTSAVAPSCVEHFEDRNLLYDITFGKDRLSDWKEIRSTAVRLLRGFSQNETPRTN